MKRFYVLSLMAVSLLAGCLPTNETAIVTPAAGATYAGMYGAPPPVQAYSELPENITITYPKNAGSLAVYLNSAPISQFFTYGATSATANFDDVAEYLRQGKNVLTVNPQTLGPSSTFIFDNAGPKVVIDKVTCQDGDCSTINGGMVTVNISVQDPSNTTSMTLFANDYLWEGGVDNSQYTPFKTGSIATGTAYPMVSLGGNKFTATIPESKLYSFVALDSNGYQATTEYLSEGQKINSVFKLRIGKTLLDSMVPVMEPMIDQLHIFAPAALANYGKAEPVNANPVASDLLDSMSRFWTSGSIFYADMGAVTTNPANCGYIDTSTWSGTEDGVYFNCSSGWDGSRCKGGNWVIPSGIAYKPGYCSQIVIWRMELDDISNMSFTLKDNANGWLALDLKMNRPTKPKALYTDLGIRNIRCGKLSYQYGGFLGIGAKTAYYTDKYCRDEGGVMAIPVLGPNLGDMKVSANTGNPTGDIKVLIKDGALDLGFNNVKLNLTGLAIGSGFDVFIGALSGLLDGLFVGIVQNTLRQNLTDFKLGADITTDAGGSMRIQSQAYQVFTNADNNPATPTEWYMYYTGFLKPLDAHPDVDPVLGSFFVRDALALPSDNTSSAIDNFSIGINANIINQGLASLYRSGVMHFTVANFQKDGGAKVYIGPNATNAETGIVSGDMRTVLMPNSPATFEMDQISAGTQATLEYQGAAMDIQVYQNNAWKTMFHAKVDIKAGVLLSVVDQKVRMTIEGTPQISIHELLDFNVQLAIPNSTFSLFAGKAVVETLVNQLLAFAIPQVADSFMVIDVPDIPGPLNTSVITTTEGIEANNGAHLGFSMGLNLQ